MIKIFKNGANFVTEDNLEPMIQFIKLDEKKETK